MKFLKIKNSQEYSHYACSGLLCSAYSLSLMHKDSDYAHISDLLSKNMKTLHTLPHHLDESSMCAWSPHSSESFFPFIICMEVREKKTNMRHLVANQVILTANRPSDAKLQRKNTVCSCKYITLEITGKIISLQCVAVLGKLCLALRLSLLRRAVNWREVSAKTLIWLKWAGGIDLWRKMKRSK